MSSFKRYQLLFFFVLAFLLSWLVWGTQVAQARGALSFHIPGNLAFWGLTLAAFVTAALAGGRPAVMDLLRRMVRWRVSPLWYAVALLLMPALCVLALGLYALIQRPVYIGANLSVGAVISYLVIETLLFLATEETAWRGFALPRLQARYSALVASLILGVIWGVWHTPLFFIPGSFQSMLPYVGFVLSAIATSVLTTWVFNHSRGSVLLAALFHAATDASILFSNVMAGERALFWLFVGLQWVAVLVITLVEGTASLARSRELPGETVYPPVP